MKPPIAILCSLLCSLLLATGARAQADRPLRLLVGFPPGGSVDIASRLLGERMAVDLRQPVIVENRAGAGGRIAAEALKSAPADGSTVMLAPIVVPVLAPLVFSKLNYDPVADFAPVAHVANFQFSMSINAAHPARDLRELLDWFRANPGKANYGSPAAGGLPHFFGVMIARNAGIDMVHVPFSGGAPLMNALAGNQVSSGIDTVVDQIEMHRGGRTRIVAVTGATRSPLLPEVPTFAELGVKGIDAAGWFALFAPARTPAAEVQRINAAVNKALASPELRERYLRFGLVPVVSTPRDLADLLARDRERWAPVVKASGFRAD